MIFLCERKYAKTGYSWSILLGKSISKTGILDKNSAKSILGEICTKMCTFYKK